MEQILEILGNFLNDIELLGYSIFDWVSELFNVIVSNPALLIVSFGLLIVGAVFGYVSRLIKGR